MISDKGLAFFSDHKYISSTDESWYSLHAFDPWSITMFSPLQLEELLKNTGLRYRPNSFIHGALTAMAIAPFYRGGDEVGVVDDVMTCLVLFDVQPQAFPRKGHVDPRILQVFNYVDEIEFEILNELEDRRFEPYFGARMRSAPGIAIAREWCQGFLLISGESRIFPEPEKVSEHARQALGMLDICAFSHAVTLPHVSVQPLEKAFENPGAAVSGCVYDIDCYWRQWDALHEDGARPGENRLFCNTPLISRADPCPCGSGKPFGTCCGRPR
jgi:hypothetical protein